MYVFVNPEGVFPFQHVTVLSRTGMAFVKSDASGMENGQTGEYGHIFVQRMVRIGRKAFYNLLGRKGGVVCGELLQATVNPDIFVIPSLLGLAYPYLLVANILLLFYWNSCKQLKSPLNRFR